MRALLVVEDDLGARRTLVRYLGQDRLVRAAANAEEAIRQIGAHDDWAGFLIDVGLGRHRYAGLDVLAAVRRVFPELPAALVTAANDPVVVNRGAVLGAMYIMKPFGREELGAFLARVAASEAAILEPLARRLHSVGARWALTAREAEVLAWLAAERTREAWVLDGRGSAGAWNEALRRLLAKAGFSTSGELLESIVRDHARAVERGWTIKRPPPDDEDAGDDDDDDRETGGQTTHGSARNAKRGTQPKK